MSLQISDNLAVKFEDTVVTANFPFTKKWIAPFGADAAPGIPGQTPAQLKQQAFSSSSAAELTNISGLVNQVYTDANFAATHAYVITWINTKSSADRSSTSVIF